MVEEVALHDRLEPLPRSRHRLVPAPAAVHALWVRLFQGRLSLWGMVRGRCPRLPYASPSGIACAESAMKAADPACALRSRASSRRGVCFRSSFAKADSSSLSEWQAGGFVPIGRAQTDFHVVGFYEGKLKKEVEKHRASKSEFTKSVALTRSRGRAALCLALCMLGLSLSATARDDRKPTIITYDVPGAGTGAGQRTIGGGIIPNGAILGEYVDANNVYHGFVRARDGNINNIRRCGCGGHERIWHQPSGGDPGGIL